MPTVRHIERQIVGFEGFDVTIRDARGSNVRGDRVLARGYEDYVRRAPDTNTVAEWKANRFAKQFVGFNVDVLDGSGNVVPGQTRLATVRASY